MSTKMREMSDEKQGSTARANFKKLSYTWKQSEDELIMVFDQEGLTPNQKDLDISFGDQYVLIKFPDGKQTWSLIFAKNIDRENTKVQWKKKKLHITMKKKCPQIWSSLERVLKKLQSEPSSEDISEAKKTDLSSVSSTEVMTSGQASGDTPSPDQMSTSEATGDDSGQGDTQTSDEYCVDKDKEEEPVYQLEHVKNSFLEKDDTMTVQIYVKEVKKDTVEVNMTDQTFSVKFSTMNPQFLNLHKDTTSDTIFNWEVKLKHEIVPEKCRYKLTPSVLEITLSKEVSRRWGALEAPQRKGKGQSIQSAVEHHTSLEKTALIGAFKIMYWLAKEEIPHTTHFASLLDLAKNLGCDYLNLLQKGESVNYTSQRIMPEILHSISLQISTPIIDAIQQSTYYSLLVDETTDVSVLKQLTVMARYFNQDLELKTSFLTLIDVPDGKADTLVAALKQFMTENQLPAHSFIGLGSDGAAVMVGKKTGVATQLKADLNSELINIHCIAHMLALAAAQASNNIPYLQKFKSILGQLFYYYQNSAVRMSVLKQLEHILGDPAIKLKEVGDSRWLSHETAVRAVSQCLPSLITSLECEASERHDATAAGLATFVKSPSFVCTLAMLGDVLPHLNRLSKLFQKTSVDFTLVDPLVSSTQMTLLRLLEYPAENMTNLPTRFEQLEEYGVKGSETDITSFKERIYHQYINNLVENLHQRFPDTNILDALSVFDPELIDKEDPSLHEWLQHQKLKTLSDHFTSVGSFEMVKTEFHSLRQLIAVNMKDHSLRDAMLKVIQLGDMYPALVKYCMIALVLPVSTADCERSFSTMARIKSVLRNLLSQRVLNQLMCISIEGPSSSDFNFPSCVSAFG